MLFSATRSGGAGSGSGGRREWASKRRMTYLLVGKAQLMLEDRLAIGQELDLIGQGVESVRQAVSELKVVHSHGEREDGRRKRREEKRQSGAVEEEGAD